MSHEHSNLGIIYQLSKFSGVPVDGPGAEGHTTLGDASADEPLVLGRDELWRTKRGVALYMCAVTGYGQW